MTAVTNKVKTDFLLTFWVSKPNCGIFLGYIMAVIGSKIHTAETESSKCAMVYGLS